MKETRKTDQEATKSIENESLILPAVLVEGISNILFFVFRVFFSPFILLSHHLKLIVLFFTLFSLFSSLPVLFCHDLLVYHFIQISFFLFMYMSSCLGCFFNRYHNPSFLSFLRLFLFLRLRFFIYSPFTQFLSCPLLFFFHTLLFIFLFFISSSSSYSCSPLLLNVTLYRVLYLVFSFHSSLFLPVISSSFSFFCVVSQAVTSHSSLFLLVLVLVLLTPSCIVSCIFLSFTSPFVSSSSSSFPYVVSQAFTSHSSLFLSSFSFYFLCIPRHPLVMYLLFFLSFTSFALIQSPFFSYVVSSIHLSLIFMIYYFLHHFEFLHAFSEVVHMHHLYLFPFPF